MKYQVYVHHFENGKKYVGLSTEENINRRWKNGYGYKTQKLIYRAILKYGWNNIKHTVYQCDTEKEMKYLERYLIAYYHSNEPKYGYNVSAGGDGSTGVPSKYRKAVDQYDKQGRFIRTWESITAIVRELNYDHTTISKCAKGERSTAYNCYWCYSGKKPIFKTRWIQRKVYQYSLTGEFIAEFKNAAEAGRSIGKGRSLIVKCCNGKCKTAYKFIFKYEC